MTDAVFPETVFVPAIAMIGGNYNGGIMKSSSRGFNSSSTCSKQARCRMRQVRLSHSLAAGKDTGIVVTVPPQLPHANRAHESPYVQKQHQRLLR